MLNLCLDHIPLLDGSWNYQDWSTAMCCTLLSEELWTYISEGTDPLDLVNYSTVPPSSIMSKSLEAEVMKARAFVVGNAKANAVIHRRIAPLVASNIPPHCEDSFQET